MCVGGMDVSLMGPDACSVASLPAPSAVEVECDAGPNKCSGLYILLLTICVYSEECFVLDVIYVIKQNKTNSSFLMA